MANQVNRQRKKGSKAYCYLGSVFDMEDSDFELQIFEGAVLADVREGGREFLGRGVGGESFYGVGSGGAKFLGYRVQVFRIPSQDGDGKISVRRVCEDSTDTSSTGGTLMRRAVNAFLSMARLLRGQYSPLR